MAGCHNYVVPLLVPGIISIRPKLCRAPKQNHDFDSPRVEKWAAGPPPPEKGWRFEAAPIGCFSKNLGALLGGSWDLVAMYSWDVLKVLQGYVGMYRIQGSCGTE